MTGNGYNPGIRITRSKIPPETETLDAREIHGSRGNLAVDAVVKGMVSVLSILLEIAPAVVELPGTEGKMRGKPRARITLTASPVPALAKSTPIS
jgi:hypothetical protein